MTDQSMDVREWLRKGLAENGQDLVREMLTMMAQMLMNADVDALCGAAYGTRSEARGVSIDVVNEAPALFAQARVRDFMGEKTWSACRPGWVEPCRR